MDKKTVVYILARMIVDAVIFYLGTELLYLFKDSQDLSDPLVVVALLFFSVSLFYGWDVFKMFRKLINGGEFK